VRSGALPAWKVEVAAYCGDEPAADALGLERVRTMVFTGGIREKHVFSPQDPHAFLTGLIAWSSAGSRPAGHGDAERLLFMASITASEHVLWSAMEHPSGRMFATKQLCRVALIDHRRRSHDYAENVVVNAAHAVNAVNAAHTRKRWRDAIRALKDWVYDPCPRTFASWTSRSTSLASTGGRIPVADWILAPGAGALGDITRFDESVSDAMVSLVTGTCSAILHAGFALNEMYSRSSESSVGDNEIRGVIENRLIKWALDSR
jgi:hypothetical protein